MNEILATVFWAIDRRAVPQLEAATRGVAKGTSDSPAKFSTDGDTAILPIRGPLLKNENWISNLLGWSTHAGIIGASNQIATDSKIRNVVLKIDSPGGSVAGTMEATDGVYRMRRSGKKVVAFADGLMASAAYWIGSAADEILLSRGAEVGSVGVFAIVPDESKRLENEGVKLNLFTSGKFKGAAAGGLPMSSEQAGYFQAQIDQLAGQFKSEVSKNRGAIPAQAMEGQTFFAADAIRNRFADRIVSGGLDEIVGALNSRKPIETETSAAHQNFWGLVEETVKSRGLGRVEAIKETIGKNPATYRAWKASGCPTN